MNNNKLFILSNPIHFLALGFGSGLLKPAPGTWGTLASIPIYLLFVNQFSSSNLIAYGLFIVVTFAIGVYICGKTASDVGVHDHGSIVWDEFVGFFITMTMITPDLKSVVLGLLLFRLFDIVKPWPIKLVDRSLQGGFGIMFDDVLAGIMACLVLHSLQLIL